MALIGSNRTEGAFFVLRIIGLAGSVTEMLGQQPAMVGQYVAHYNPDAFRGRGYATGTRDLTHAVRFDSVQDALAFWKQQSEVRPYRDDGRPNRPLTAFTVEVVPMLMQ